ncbi:hypothetical protein ACJVDH_19835 [Pedobacter sp. AW1-32]|uniref:hypothetical protein n=1 Tax=Pedobacter sp. AW1-32 TaxID=3383026 RepID=UPI003FEE665B
MLRTKKILLFVALGAMFAQAASLVTPKTASAQEETLAAENGSCYPAKSHICGLNGHNYNDKSYQGG